MKRNFLRFSLLSILVALCGGMAVSAMLGEKSESPATGGISRVAEVDKTATWDYANATVMSETMAFSGSSASGSVKAVEDNGLVMTVVSNGAAFRNNGDNIQVRTGAEFRIPVVTTEDLVTVKGYPGYFSYTVGGVAAANAETTYKAKNSDVQRGYVSVVSTGDNNYYYSLSVQQMKPRQLLVLDNAAATATFKFDQGTEKQTATFNEADYFVSSKVTYGSNLKLDGKDNKSLNQTWFNPVSKQSGAKDDNLIRFIIQPKFGLTFTPTKVSFKSTRFGTGGGHMDISWVNPDGSKVSLAKDQLPPRDNESPNVKEFSYNITGAKPGEGACGLAINLYSLDPGKHVGFSDIVIEGTLSGNEKEVPVLESFSANGVDYVVDDIFEADGDSYVATIELASYETMISEANPVSKVVAASGETGTVTYAGTADKCDVTIPVSLKDVTINYIIHFVRRPIYTLTYYNTNGVKMGTQKVEKGEKIVKFNVDYTTAVAEEGYKVRGWFEKPTKSRKVTVDDVVTGNMSIYALASEIEVESLSRKYTFDLTSDIFYPEDHEAFNTVNGYWHDKSHGWGFKDGDKIDLLVGPKAIVTIGLCQYGYGTTIDVTDASGIAVCEPIAAKAATTDGELASFTYEGTGGTITLTLHGTGEIYIHNVKIANTSEVSYTKEGRWYYVKPNDVYSLFDAIDAVNAANAAADAERSFIYVPNGTYDMRETVLTTISGNNVSLIGQSREGVMIVNAPNQLNEGIGTTATILNHGRGLYMQDLTLKNAMDYYGALGLGLQGGRAVVLQDKGTNTIGKNIELISCQDTYYSNNNDGLFYFEDSHIHGTVDFFCGGGRMFMEGGSIVVEPRNANGSGECTLTAPTTKAGDKYGYVFNNVYIDNKAERYNFGRAWQNEPKAAFINTIVSDNKLNSSRWTAGGMNVPAKEFVEYNTMDKTGKVVSPASHIMTFTKGTASNKMETILTAAQAAEFTVEKVFPDWNPEELTVQAAAPLAKFENGNITWTAVEGAIAYALFNNGELAGITSSTSFPVDAAVAADGNFSIRSVNPMGGMGKEAPVDGLSGIDDIEAPSSEIVGTVYYNLQGIMVDDTSEGVLVRVDTLSDGRTVTTKVMNR